MTERARSCRRSSAAKRAAPSAGQPRLSIDQNTFGGTTGSYCERVKDGSRPPSTSCRIRATHCSARLARSSAGNQSCAWSD
jgi:hypothetical protein